MKGKQWLKCIVCLGRVLRKERSRDRWWASSIPSRTSPQVSEGLEDSCSLRLAQSPVDRCVGCGSLRWVTPCTAARHLLNLQGSSQPLTWCCWILRQTGLNGFILRCLFYLKGSRYNVCWMLGKGWGVGVRACVHRGLYIIPGNKREFLWNTQRCSWDLFPDCHTGGE